MTETDLLPLGVVRGPPNPELKLDRDSDTYRPSWYDRERRHSHRGFLSPAQAATAFPKHVKVEPPEVLRATKPFACSGSMDSSRYQEATKFRAMPDMGWEEARIALNRLSLSLRYDDEDDDEPRTYAALAEFALSAAWFEGFFGRKGDHAGKLRTELGRAINQLHRGLHALLGKAESNAALLARPITQHGDLVRHGQVLGNPVIRLWAMVPTAADQWVRVIEATPDQVMDSLDYLRETLAIWDARCQVAADVLDRLVGGNNLPTGAEYAEASHIAAMLAFTTEKLLTLYSAIMYSMPIYRLYPATSEPEALALWWPWGRPAPLVDGGPPRRPKPRKRVLDPAIITTTRPQDIVREVMRKTGINRTTAQRLTAAMRAELRTVRKAKATRLLLEGRTKAEVAREVGLSPSRISALFKGKQQPDLVVARALRSLE